MILQKVVLICDKSKVYVDEERFARDRTFCKCNCPFDIVALIKDNVWILQVQKVGHNHEPMLPGAYSTHKRSQWLKISNKKFHTRLKLTHL